MEHACNASMTDDDSDRSDAADLMQSHQKDLLHNPGCFTGIFFLLIKPQSAKRSSANDLPNMP